MKTIYVIEFMFVFVLFVVLLTFLSSKYEKKTMAEASLYMSLSLPLSLVS